MSLPLVASSFRNRQPLGMILTKSLDIWHYNSLDLSLLIWKVDVVKYAPLVRQNDNIFNVPNIIFGMLDYQP